MRLAEECRVLVTELRKGEQPEDFLLTRNGEPVRDFRGAWNALVKAAGLPGLLLHDFRRSVVRNMIRRGVPQKDSPRNFRPQDGCRLQSLQHRERSGPVRCGQEN
jgi:hypothetical protein